MKRFISSLIIALAASWFGQTLLVDFFIVPSLFRGIDDFFQAGALGIGVFEKFNNIELVTASGLLALSALSARKSKSSLLAFLLCLVLFSISVLYLTHLTPKIAKITQLWRKADLMGLAGVSGIPDLQQEHQFFHRLYIGIDTLKLALLLFLAGLTTWKGDSWK